MTTCQTRLIQPYTTRRGVGDQYVHWVRKGQNYAVLQGMGELTSGFASDRGLQRPKNGSGATGCFGMAGENDL